MLILHNKKKGENCLDRQKMDCIIQRTFYFSQSAGINHEYTENKERERGLSIHSTKKQKQQQQHHPSIRPRINT
jgi:hypothetical protein